MLPYFDSKATYYNYKNPRIDGLLDKRHRALDKAERKKILTEAQMIIYQDAAEINIYSTWSFVAVHPYVKGYIPSSTYSYRREDVWLDK